MKKPAVIVDGYSTGMLLAPEFKRRGHECIHVQSSQTIPPAFHGSANFNPADYKRRLIHSGNLNLTLESLNNEEPLCVIPGVEPGVELADSLATELFTPANDIHTRAARRNKFEMVGALEKAGLRTIPTTKTRDVHEALSWIEGVGGFPAVVKPTSSFGTDGVLLCRSSDDVAAAYRTHLDQKNILNIINQELIVQKYIRGQEYVVDTVSHDSCHCVTDIWSYGKRESDNDASFVYDHAWLLPNFGEIQNSLCEYAKRSLDSLGIKFGPAHCEIMVDEEGPVLVEVGARLCGGMIPQLCSEAIGSGQLEATVEAFSNPKAFSERVKSQYTLRKNVLRVLLVSRTQGTLKNFPYFDDLHSLPSFHRAHFTVLPGDHLAKTTNFFTHPGRVDLMHLSRETLATDMQKIRSWEAEDFYQIEPQRGSL